MSICNRPKPLNSKYGTSQLPSIPVYRRGDASIGDDTYLPLRFNQPYQHQLVRLGTIGDGSCFFHAILKAYYPPYASNPSFSHRSKLVRNLRNDLAAALELIDPRTNLTYYESANNGAWKEFSKTILVDDLNRPIDYSLRGIQKLLYSNDYIGDEIYGYVCDMIGIDLYLLKLDEDETRPVISVVNNRPAVVIGGNGFHYETIGVIRDNLIQTVFLPDDPLIKILRCMFNQ
jgi:hypothetical protein